jgi:hypothetical protein
VARAIPEERLPIFFYPDANDYLEVRWGTGVRNLGHLATIGVNEKFASENSTKCFRRYECLA